MNGLPPAPLARPRSSGGNTSHATAPPSSNSPKSTKGKVRTPKRSYDKTDLGSSSAESADDGGGGRGDRKRQPGVKRACNECRQQKCDVVTEPTYLPCERCRRLKLECKIDSNFKRVGKRSRNAEMEREIEELKRQLASQQTSPAVPQIKTEPSPSLSHIPPQMDTFMGSEDHAVASLMDLASGQEGGSFMRSPNARLLMSRRLGDVALSQDQVHELFQIFFAFYHPFLPILDHQRPPDDFYEASPLLFWVIISVAARRYFTIPTLLASLAGPLSKLLWEQVAEVPQTYIFVKALCVLCTWPLPISSTSSDPTFMLSGLNLHVAMQIGLHRPSHAQDFTKFKVEFMEDELRDRVRTWASCNAVAQRVATGYGQPPSTFYDWTLTPSGVFEPGFVLPKDAQNRLLIERFNSKVTEALYRNRSDPVGLASDEERFTLTKFLAQDYEEVERRLRLPDSFSFLYLRAAGLHFRLSILFASPTSQDYNAGLFSLWQATTAFLESAFSLENSAGKLLAYSSNYVLQMIIAAGFTLLKLLNSFFASFVDLSYGRRLFTETIRAIRAISVTKSDLPSRLAEVLTQLWKGSGAGSKNPQLTSNAMENSLQLKVKCRMSMSLVFDSVWRWREEFQALGRGNLEAALRNPTNPDSNFDSSAASVADHSHATSVAPGEPNTITPDGFGVGESYNEVFDPLNWMFDGFVDFPYSLPAVPGIDGQ
ncbi:MAG: hypothetical protein Q9217_005786 [Psora testacea]